MRVKRGRPRLPQGEVKDKLLQIRLNDEQLRNAKEEAKKRGMNTSEMFLLGLSALLLWEAFRDKK